MRFALLVIGVANACTCDDILGSALSCSDRGLQEVENLDTWLCQSELQTLSSLRFDGNNLASLSFLGSNRDFPLVEHFYLEDNDLIAFDTNATFPLLQYIHLTRNHITTLDANAFNKQTPTLVGLNVQNNGILEIKNVFNLPRLQSLRLARNNLTDLGFLNSTNVTSLPDLRFLNLDNNKLRNLDFGVLNNQTPMLTSVTLQGNNISHLVHLDTATMSELFDISLDNNLLTDLPGFASSKLPSLAFLSLAGNKLAKLDFFQGANFSSLNKLNLAFNSISNIDGLAQGNFLSLATLFLASNDLLLNVDILSVGDFPALTKIFLSPATIIGSTCQSSAFFANFVSNSSTFRCSEMLYNGTILLSEVACNLENVIDSCSPTNSPTAIGTRNPTVASTSAAGVNIPDDTSDADKSLLIGLAVGGVVAVAGFSFAIFMVFFKSNSHSLNKSSSKVYYQNTNYQNR